MSFTTLFFDVDDTLYPASSGLWEAIRERMSEFMHEQLNLPPQEIPKLSRSYYEKYGTTLRGLQIHYQIDPEDYLTYVHDLPLERFLKPDPDLHALLLSLPQNNWIFTNADEHHARGVTEALGISDCFTGIIDVRAMDYHCKPEVEAYQRAMVFAEETEYDHCVLIDDSARNLAPAHDLGMFTILVGTNQSNPAANETIQNLKDLPIKIPQLWS
jgi:putative hydrolase of the HAD superfamily